MTLIDKQFASFSAIEKYRGATISPQQPNGTFIVTVPNIKLRDGWSSDRTTVYFALPAGYPSARPDTFWTSPLRLRNGSPPKATNQSPAPGVPADALWYSWHPQAWNPNSDSILTYMRMIEKRLEAVE